MLDTLTGTTILDARASSSPAAIDSLGSRDGQLAGVVTAADLTVPLAPPRATGLGWATPDCSADASYYRTDTGTPAWPRCAAPGPATGRRLDGGALTYRPCAMTCAHREGH